MAKTKRKNSGDFDAILAGFAQQPSKKAPAYQSRRPASQAQSKQTNGAPRSENSVRRLFKNISFPNQNFWFYVERWVTSARRL